MTKSSSKVIRKGWIRSVRLILWKWVFPTISKTGWQTCQKQYEAEFHWSTWPSLEVTTLAPMELIGGRELRPTLKKSLQESSRLYPASSEDGRRHKTTRFMISWKTAYGGNWEPRDILLNNLFIFWLSATSIWEQRWTVQIKSSTSFTDYTARRSPSPLWHLTSFWMNTRKRLWFSTSSTSMGFNRNITKSWLVSSDISSERKCSRGVTMNLIWVIWLYPLASITKSRWWLFTGAMRALRMAFSTATIFPHHGRTQRKLRISENSLTNVSSTAVRTKVSSRNAFWLLMLSSLFPDSTPRCVKSAQRKLTVKWQIGSKNRFPALGMMINQGPMYSLPTSLIFEIIILLEQLSIWTWKFSAQACRCNRWLWDRI